MERMSELDGLRAISDATQYRMSGLGDTSNWQPFVDHPHSAKAGDMFVVKDELYRAVKTYERWLDLSHTKADN